MSETFRRILIKISGESLGGKSSFTLESFHQIAKEIAQIRETTQVGLVIGGGNIVRGSMLESYGIDRVIGDYMGMMATVINSLLLQQFLSKEGQNVRIITAQAIEGIGETYSPLKCIKYLEKGNILIFAGGTGHPYFTTDTTAAVRAAEMKAECFFKATKVDGVYDDDPAKNPKARKFDFLSYQQVLLNQYKVMDLTAISFCMENKIPVRVFNLMQPGNLLRAVRHENIGTIISE